MGFEGAVVRSGLMILKALPLFVYFLLYMSGIGYFPIDREDKEP